MSQADIEFVVQVAAQLASVDHRRAQEPAARPRYVPIVQVIGDRPRTAAGGECGEDAVDNLGFLFSYSIYSIVDCLVRVTIRRQDCSRGIRRMPLREGIMRSPRSLLAFAFVFSGFFPGEAFADCYLEGHPICSAKCNGFCRAYYDPGPPEKCDTDCRNFKVMPGAALVTIKLEGVTSDQLEKIKGILEER